MTVQLPIPYETLIELVDQLPEDQKEKLVQHLLKKKEERELSIEEKLALLDSMVVSVGAILPGYSDRREDWYGDDGR
jgi:hypothetical protein